MDLDHHFTFRDENLLMYLIRVLVLHGEDFIYELLGVS